MLNLYSRIICTGVLPLVSVATRSSFWSLYKGIHRRHTEAALHPSPAETLASLQGLVAHAYDSVPFYRRRMDALGLTPHSLVDLDALRRLPPTTKADIAANFPDGLLSSRQDHVPWKYVATSGTVDRVTIIQDFRKRDFVRAAQALSLQTATYRPGMKYMEIPPDACVNVCGAGGTQDPNVFRYLVGSIANRTIFDAETSSELRGLVERQIVYRRQDLPSFSAEGLDQPVNVLDQYLQDIDRYRPHILKALPVNLYLLAMRIQDGGMKPKVAARVMPMGSSITPHMKRTVESAFGRPVHEDYGCAEAGAMAAECSFRNGLHPFEELFHIEVLRNGRPVRDGEIGKIFVTDLSNYAMPLIRYEIGDVGTLHRSPCACGLTSARLDVQGRVHDCVVADDGSILTQDAVVDSILTLPGVLGFQLEERHGGEFQVRVVPRGIGGVHLDSVRDTLVGLVGKSRRIVARQVRTLLPERGGKYRFVKNLTDSPSQVLN